MRPEWSLRLSLERSRSSVAPCGCGHLSSFPSSLLMLLAGCILPQKGFLELGFGFLFGVQHSVLFFSCTLAFRSWETTDLSLCRTWSHFSSALCIAPCWGSHRHSPCPLALQLASKRRCSPESLSRSRCSEEGSASSRNRSYIGGRSIDKPTFM